jgi:hypothetical protein
VLTSVAIRNTVGNDCVVICSGWAGLDNTVANTVAKVDIGAEAECVWLAVLKVRAAESTSCCEHVVDADLLRKALMNAHSGKREWELVTYTACREGRQRLGRGKADKGSECEEGLHVGGRMRLQQRQTFQGYGVSLRVQEEDGYKMGSKLTGGNIGQRAGQR